MSGPAMSQSLADMQPRGMLCYESIRPLTAERGNARIFAPNAYPLVRNTQLVPIVHIEALALATFFPICWQEGAPRPQLIVLRSLNRNGSGQPGGSPANPATLPLALRAYPFAVGMGARQKQNTILIDDAIPDKPHGIGAPILTSDGRAGRGTQTRLQTAIAFNKALAMTEKITDELCSSGLLEPWRWESDDAAKSVAEANLLVVRPNAYDSAKVFRFVRKCGAAGASFLGAHRISLYRASALVQAAQAAKAAVDT